MMSWFGPSWGAGVCDPATHMTLPIGRTCLACKEPFESNSRGLQLPLIEGTPEKPRTSLCYWHLDCFLAHLGISRELHLC